MEDFVKYSNSCLFFIQVHIHMCKWVSKSMQFKVKSHNHYDKEQLLLYFVINRDIFTYVIKHFTQLLRIGSFFLTCWINAFILFFFSFMKVIFFFDELLKFIFVCPEFFFLYDIIHVLMPFSQVILLKGDSWNCERPV